MMNRRPFKYTFGVMVILSLAVLLSVTGISCKGARASGSTVTGRAMRLPTMNPVAFVRVLVQGPEATRLQVTDSNGSYTMYGVPVGTYDVTFARFGRILYTQQLAVMEDEETYVVDLPTIPQGTDMISGTITSLENPVPGAEVWLILDDGGLASTTTNQIGEYTLSGLSSGNYTVIVEADNYVEEVFEDVFIGFEGDVTVNADLEPMLQINGGTVSGTVTDKQGEVLADAYVGIFPGGTIPSLTMVAVAETISTDTGYVMFNLPPGTYTMICTRSGYFLVSDILIMEDSGNYTIDFELQSD